MKNFWKVFAIAQFLLAAGSFSSLQADKNPYQYSSGERLISFRVLYPYMEFDSSKLVSRQRLNGAGIELDYQFYLLDRLGISFSPWVWFLLMRTVGGNKSKIAFYSYGLGIGPSFRFFPGSYFDPTVTLRAGVGASDAGNAGELRASFPMEAKLALDLYKNTSPYRDSSLALTAFGGAGYILRSQPYHDPIYFTAGLAFKGSF